MKSHIDITKRIQIIWWGEKPRFAIWKYPRGENDRMPHLFTGIVFGLFEIRIWRKRLLPPYQK